MYLKSAATAAAFLCLSPAAGIAAVNPDAVTCNSVVACIYGQNVSTVAGTDIGLEGLSVNGFGLVGVTSSSASAAGVAGLYGKDQGRTRNNSGVLGLSTYGVGVKGSGSTGLQGTGGNGVVGYSNATSGAGVAGIDTNGIGGLFADLGTGIGLAAQSSGGPAFVVQSGVSAAASGPLIIGESASDIAFYFDAYGNEYLTGSLTLGSSGTTYDTATATKGRNLATYGARTASPTLEDVGESKLSAGAAHVTLDPAFASTINTGSYMVFITPEGDSNGLYTAARTANGFDVREHAGTSSVPFAYRIVATPLGSTAKRLALMKPQSPRRPSFNVRNIGGRVQLH